MNQKQGVQMITHIELLETLLQRYLQVLGADYRGYRNHVYRVLNFCSLVMPLDASQLEKLAIAGAFHDLGIWTDKTFDYLDPSERLALTFLEETGRHAWSEEVMAMIHHHHKITPVQGDAPALVEAFRKGDWIDVTHGLFAYGVSRKQRKEVFAQFPDAGFHRRLLQLSFKRLLTHPLSPLPMMKL
jgi:hypothetical protein